MGENAYFQNALADFTREAASGGAIRHLAGLGYSVRQIADSLDYPTPYAKIQAAVWEQLLKTGTILRGRPGGEKKEKAVYIREYDKYGKASFRRIVEAQEEKSICWRERVVSLEGPDAEKDIYSLLLAKQEENGVEHSYMSCDFGIFREREPLRYEALLSTLEEKQREYVAGLPWENGRMYHRLTPLMLDILFCLYRQGMYQGECCFCKTGEALSLS